MKTASGYIMPHVPYIKEDNKIEHEYVEIAGIKWATMNIGAENITDTGLYFAWGDTQGYTADQVGSSTGQKYFGWVDYKYSNDNGSVITKYNATDGKTALDTSDDAVTAAWSGSWRMPTTAEFQALGAAVNTEWVTDYQGSGVNGRLMTDKTDSSKTLFFPACGYCYIGSVINADVDGYYWSSSLSNNLVQLAYDVNFSSNSVLWLNNCGRLCGCTVRGILDE